MSLKCGIIGITNSGKSTLFNCISDTKTEITNFAFSTNKSNLGNIKVPDNRLEKLEELQPTEKVVPAEVNIVDVPGLAKGSNRGEGVGNKFLGDIRNTDALIHVIRCFDDENLPHIDGSVHPVRDMETVELELQVKDLDSVEKKISKIEKLVRAGEKEAKKELDILIKYKDHLESFQSARTLDISENEREFAKDMQLLTEKPVLYVCNVDESSAVEGNHHSRKLKEALGQDEEILIIAAEAEAEITELETQKEREEFLKDMGLNEPGVNKLIRASYKMLNLQSFFTIGPKEIRAWTIKKGMNAQEAAGVIHSDMEKGFIRSEVIDYKDFMKYKTENACKENGKLRLEGKSYIVQDGDLMHIRFNV